MTASRPDPHTDLLSRYHCPVCCSIREWPPFVTYLFKMTHHWYHRGSGLRVRYLTLVSFQVEVAGMANCHRHYLDIEHKFRISCEPQHHIYHWQVRDSLSDVKSFATSFIIVSVRLQTRNVKVVFTCSVRKLDGRSMKLIHT